MTILVLLLLVIAIPASLAVLGTALVKTTKYILKERRLAKAHRLARNIKPQKGQVWIQDGEKDNAILIQDVAEDGTLVLSSEKTSHSNKPDCWKDTPASWQERFNNRRLTLG